MGILVIVVVAAVIALACAALLSLRALGLQPEWLGRTRHAIGEARLRVAGVLAEFGDWLRLGR